MFGLYLLFEKIKITKLTQSLILISVLIALAYTTKSYIRIPVWKDNLALNYSGIKDAPKSWRTHILLADELRQQAVKLSTDTINMKINQDTAQVIFKKAVYHFNKGYSILGNFKQYSFLQGLGECYLHLKDTMSAKATFIRAVENPKLFFGLFKLGMISFNEKDYNTAINYYQKALNADSPDLFSTYKNMGASYLMLKEYQKSIASYEKALEYGISHDITTNLSFLYASTGNLLVSEKIISNNNSLSNEEKEPYTLMSAAMGFYNQGKYAEAIQYFKKCDEEFVKMGGHKKFPDFLNSWARSHLNLNEIASAKAIFTRVIQADSKNYYALMNLGNIAFHNEKNYAQATEFFSKCIEANSPDYFLSYSNLGTLYLVQNQSDKAIENYEMSLKYGSSPTVLGNLYLLWKSKGNQEKMVYYQKLMDNK